jgi:hypothetical protein
MKKVTLNTANTKKLQLKKTAIAHLQMSEEKMKMLIGGGNKITTGSNGCGSTEVNTCDPTDICNRTQ